MANIAIDTTGKDLNSIVDSLIDFATIKYGAQASSNRVWSDFNISSFSRNWAELVAYVGDQLMFYMDTQANQAYLRSATIPSFVIDIANQLGYEVPTQKSASGKVQLTFSGPASVDAFYRVFAGDVQFITTRAVVANQAEVVEVDAIQGARFTESFTADGIQNESLTLQETDIIVDLDNPNPELRSPIVVVNGTTYNVVTTQVDSAPNSTDVVRKELPDGRTKLIFGDGIFARRLVENESINITYRTQGGSQGNVEAGEITTLSSAVTNLASVNNSTSFSGGVDRLTLQQIKDRVPLSLKTVAGAVSLTDFADILIANFPQVLTAKADLNLVDTGIDINVYVLPNAESVSNVSDNNLLLNTLTDFIERKKVVGTQFLIKDAEPIQLKLDIEAYLEADASRSAVESDIRSKIEAMFNVRTGGVDGAGIKFQQVVKVSDLFDLLREVNGLARFEINKHTVIPRVEQTVASVNQDFYVSRVDVYGTSGKNEWLVATSELSNPEPANGQVGYKVFKRTLGEVTSLTEDSITDSNLDLTVLEGNAVVTGGSTLSDLQNVFTPAQFDDFLLVDSSNNIWRIEQTKSSSLKLSSPSLTNAAVVAASNGPYRIVQSFSGKVIGVGESSFTILYNNRNTFFSQGASFNLITTLRSKFILSEEQTNTGTYGVPVSIANVTPSGSSVGDLVSVGFNGNPNLSDVDTDFVLVDSAGEVFEIDTVSDNDSSIATYNNVALIDDSITLVDSGNDEAVSVKFTPSKQVDASFVQVSVSLEKTNAPSGFIFAEIREDNAGVPGALIATSAQYPVSSIIIGSQNLVNMIFSASMQLDVGTEYHLVVASDTAYKTSYFNGAGSVKVGIDTSTLDYRPSTTAAGFVRLESTALDILSQATGTIEVTDNFIRSSKQATALITLLNNADFSTGTNRITIAGQPFTAVVGAPAPSGEFQIGASLTDTRDNLRTAINTQMVGVVAATDVGADSFTLTADATNYKGELGNDITLEFVDQGVQNFSFGGLDSLVGGIDGDSISVVAPQYLNSVSYTYDSSTGVVQFSSAVSLPSFQAGDLFRDGAGTEHEILAIDDGTDSLTLQPSLTVSTALGDGLSGSIYRQFTYVFGDDVAVGATATITATNLAAVIDTQPYVSASSSVAEVELTSDLNGSLGNTIRMSTSDIGQENFTLSGDTLTGGLDGDILGINGVNFVPTLSAPSADEEFQVDIGSLNNTLANLESRINAHPSLVGTLIASVNVGSQQVQIAADSAGSAGNAITLELVEDSSGQITISGATLEGGSDNVSVQSYNGSTWSVRAPESDLIFHIALASDTLTVVSKADSAGNQVIPTLSVGGVFDAGLGQRYYSDNSEVSFTIITRSPNSLIIGGEQVDMFGRGVSGGAAGVRVDQFVFRTSSLEDDITNLRPNEIPVIQSSNLKTNLLGGVS